MLRALTLPDVPVIQAVTITFVVIYVMLNLIVDISYGYLNPRVRSVVSEQRCSASRRLGAARRRHRAEPAARSRIPASRSTRRSSRTRTPSPWRRALQAPAPRQARDDRARVPAAVHPRGRVRVAGRAARPGRASASSPSRRRARTIRSGTDHLGRDTFSRIVYGAQVSLRSGLPDRGPRGCWSRCRSACSPASGAAAPT